MESTEAGGPFGLRLSEGLGPTATLVERLRQERRATAWTRGLDVDYPTAWEPNMLCHEAAAEIVRLRSALDQKRAEYDDMKSLLLGSARNLNLEGEQARQTAEYWKAEHLAGNTRIGELHDELAETASRAADYLRRAIKAEAEVALLRAAGLGA